jgi:DNA modification methylase
LEPRSSRPTRSRRTRKSTPSQADAPQPLADFPRDLPTGLVVRRVPLVGLRPDPGNTRLHDDRNLRAIRESLERWGQAEPLVVNARTGLLIAGHGRLEAMRALRWTTCDVVELDLDERQAAALSVALNRTSDLSAFDPKTLTRLLADLQADQALAGVGFDSAEVDRLIAELRAEEAPGEVDDPGPQEPPEQPVTRPGDLWLLGDHRLLCGDSTKPEDIARLMAGERAHLLATDPPYLVDYRGGNHPQSFANRPATRDKHWDDYVDPASSVAFFQGYLVAALAHCVESVPVYQWHAHKRQALVEEAWKAAGLLVHQQLIWVKARAVLTRSFFMWQHEPCFVGWPQGKMPPKDRRPSPNATSVWAIDQVGQQEGIHPTQKPLAIFEGPIGWHTRPGEVVLEPFSGSGTQIVAAQRLARRCFALDQAPAYVDAALRRWEKATAKRALLEGGKEGGQTLAEVARARGVELAGEAAG